MSRSPLLTGCLLLSLAISSVANASYHCTYNCPTIYDNNGNYMGRLSDDQYDPDSISNQYGNYGSQYSPNSINNPYRNNYQDVQIQPYQVQAVQPVYP